MASVELEAVHKAYAQLPAVIRDVNLRLADGEFCAFVGPSGCGKSTLLRLVAGLDTLSSGELRIAGRRMNDTPPAQRGVAMVFQSYALFPHMTVRQNLSFGLELAGVASATIARKVGEVAQALQLTGLLDRKPKALSGGQRQRVAIGRAIVREPGVFLFDEPLSNLDAALRVQTRFEIARLHREYGRACTIYVTHDQVEAMTLADRILLLNSGDAVARHGSVAQCGAPLELYHRPRNRFVASFIGSPTMNFEPATLLSASPGQALLALADGTQLSAAVDARRLAPGAPVTLGIRPEHVALGSSGQHLVRELRWLERLGEATYLYLDGSAPGQPWVVKAPGPLDGQPGSRVPLHLPPTALHLFDAQDQALPRTDEISHWPMPVVA